MLSKKPGLILVFILLVSSGYRLNAQLNAGGTVYCKSGRDGTLLIMLVDEETFSRPMTGLAVKEIRVSSGAALIDFEFDNVPPGIYGIRCFVDTDGNEKLNRGLFGPSEPWGMSWNETAHPGWPEFSMISFKLEKNLSDLNITVE